MPAAPEFEPKLPELDLQPLTHRLPQHRELPLPGRRAAMREAQNGDRLSRSSPRHALAGGGGRKAPKLDEVRLVGVEGEARPAETAHPGWPGTAPRRARRCEGQDGSGPWTADDVTLGVHAVSNGGPNGRTRSGGRRWTAVRTDTPGLYRHELAAGPSSRFPHTRGEPFLDEPPDASVTYTALDKLHQPFVVEGVKEPTNVRIEHPVHLLRQQPDRQRVQRPVRTPLRPEAVRAPEKVCFVDRVQDLDDGTLDDLVLQRRNIERPSEARPSSGCTRVEPASLGTRRNAGEKTCWRLAARSAPHWGVVVPSRRAARVAAKRST